MKELIDKLKKNGAFDYFNEMKLDIEELFHSGGLETDPYREHSWILGKNDGFTVVNAVPAENLQDRLFWEEWYIHENKVHHHVLSLWRPSAYNEIFICPDSDDIHPAPTFGKKWYVIDDPDMKPTLLRR